MNDNPFLAPDRFPRFDALTPEAAREALPALIAETEAKVAALEKNCPPTWEGRVAALTDATEPFSFAWHLVGHMLGTCNSPAWRAVQEELQPDVVRLSLRIAQSRPLYDALLALRDGPQWASLPEGRRRVVETAIRDARDAGVGLDGAARERFLQVGDPFIGLALVHGIHDRDLLIHDRVGIIGHAERHFKMAFKEVDIVIVAADVENGIRYFIDHIFPFLFSSKQ